MPQDLPVGLRNYLLWVPELKLGFHPKEPINYAADYFRKYVEMDATPMGAELTRLRVQMVRRHFAGGDLVDIGIGGGRFCIEADVFGFDVNASAVEWLRAQARYRDPYKFGVQAITCWDSLEHIADPENLLRQVRGWLFVSLPIFANETDCLASKHFKPGEHIWYFTHDGFIAWCEKQGFELVEWNTLETKAGREGISSYAFHRLGDH